MEENKELLKYMYHEDLYIVDEPAPSTSIQSVTGEEKENDQIEHNPSIVEEVKPVTFFGGNEKGILILVDDPAQVFLNQKDLDFLMKIIESGLRFSEQDIALVNIAKYPTDQVLDEISYNFLLSFGNKNLREDNSSSLYELTENHGKKMLFANNLTDIAGDQEKKKLLWKSMKTMFNI